VDLALDIERPEKPGSHFFGEIDREICHETAKYRCVL